MLLLKKNIVCGIIYIFYYNVFVYIIYNKKKIIFSYNNDVIIEFLNVDIPSPTVPLLVILSQKNLIILGTLLL